jgi:glutamate N-acetyltransferase/amino-acid N-acetyltransferase
MDFPAGFYITSLNGKENNFGLIYAPDGMKTAGVFTTNSCPAHPVEFSRIKIKNPLHKAILVNKGSANAATGKEGFNRLKELVSKISNKLGIDEEQVLVASTGVIGRQIEYSDAEIDKLIERSDRIEPYDFAEAIMTTDTCRKVVENKFKIEDKEIKIVGIAKGSGMIAPNLATMLVFLLTDAGIEKKALETALKKVTEVSFNCLTVDGETSTNDSVYLAASGVAGNNIINESGENFEKFYKNLEQVCTELVKKLAADGEGATKLVKIIIKEAPDAATAKKAAGAIANSPLCKTAFYGASPNWGRIVSALGAAGVKFDIEKFSLYINRVTWIKNGVPANGTQKQVKKGLESKECEIEVFLNSGYNTAFSYTCDFSPEYVKINADYLS